MLAKFERARIRAQLKNGHTWAGDIEALLDTLDEMERARDYWKAMKRALEREIREAVGDSCYLCDREACRYPCVCINGSGFRFKKELFCEE